MRWAGLGEAPPLRLGVRFNNYGVWRISGLRLDSVETLLGKKKQKELGSKCFIFALFWVLKAWGLVALFLVFGIRPVQPEKIASINLFCGSNSNQMLSKIEFVWPALMIASSVVQAGASILKEFVFVDAATRLKEKSLDIFVVNSFGSGFQINLQFRVIDVDFHAYCELLRRKITGEENSTHANHRNAISLCTVRQIG